MNKQPPENDMPAEIDFSKAARGVHHIPPGEKIFMPASIDNSKSCSTHSGLALLVSVLLAAGCSSSPSEPASSAKRTTEAPKEPRIRSAIISTLEDFNNSEFCEQYSCTPSKSWPLRTGEINHTFDVSVRTPSEEMLGVDVQTNGDKVSGLGLMFFEKDKLDSDDFRIADTLLRSTDQSRDHKATMAFVRDNIETPVFQIKLGQSSADGDFHVWAAKVTQQTLLLERIARGN